MGSLGDSQNQLVPTWRWPDQPPRRAAVLGQPISHSLSPLLHRAAYQALGLTNWRYQAVAVNQTGLAQWLRQANLLGPAAPDDWAGLSLTMPLKQVVLNLADQVDQLAADLGAANTLSWSTAGWLASNTDVFGIVSAFNQALVDKPDNQLISQSPTASILGGGATAAAALAALDQLGAAAITVHARQPERATAVRVAAERLAIAVSVMAWDDQLAKRLSQTDLIVSALPAGAADQLGQSISQLAADLTGRYLLDVAYDPWPSRLASAWQLGGGQTISGLSMLLHQAAAQVELMTGRSAPLTAMQQALGGRLLGHH